ncbi:hypothetical protein GCM10011507_30090 [Edaphobacter acidisoli]|uniref:Translocation and assembly module TamB C-terminal domain-containing protein n=1 Tax=Edaphobacter acidisoli TaxID=2040573 RepID=A0A916RYA3_9BACT|nr:translocation/assembly module TamB domain-containing protein [Edaphobacter acidisoli]GGA76770.1 hypothetical protein GCM10011507_30090 [Edaphobacter acidisoli]
MSDLERKLSEKKERLEAKVKDEVQKVKRSLASQIGRVVLWTVGSAVALAAVLFLTFAWYSTTSDFEHRVNAEVVKVLEDATGGQVEIKAIHFHLWHLAVGVDGLVIHGLEGPGEAPYLSVDRIEAQVRIVSFFSHLTGSGLASYVNLNSLTVEHPQFHLIVDKDGKTNQPVPKHPSTSNTPVMDTLLDLKAGEVLLANGVALLNDRAIPFDVAARDLDAEVHYISATERYGATVDLEDLRTKLKQEPEAHSVLHMEAQVGRDIAEVTKLDFASGKNSTLEATASLTHFAQPEWQIAAKGNLELKQVSALTGVDGLSAGTVDLDMKGHSCAVASAPEKQGFWRRFEAKRAKAPQPEPGCVSGYLITGAAKIHGVAYRDEYIRTQGVDGGATLHITPDELLLTSMMARLPGGGIAAGDMRIENWLGNAPVEKGKKPQPSHAFIDATLTKMPLRTIMDVTAPEHYGDLGFDTAVSGPVKVEWLGTNDVASTVEVDGKLAFAPTGVPRKGARSNVPVTGQTVAHYSGKNETVMIQQIALRTPGSTLEASGVLGVNNGDALTMLRTDLTVSNLGDFDQLLTTLDLEANGKRGAAAIPVVLHGSLQFNGTARGAVRDLDVKGHVQAENVEFALDQTDASIDSVTSDAEYSPDGGLAIANATVRRGSAVLNAEGTLVPRKEVSKRGVASYVWDSGMAVDATVQLADASMTDAMQIAGVKEIPVTGTVALNAHVTGTFDNMSGGGHISLVNGEAYGEPYESVGADLVAQGKDIEADNVVLKLHGMQIDGRGGYDMGSEHLHGHVEGHDLVLSKFVVVQRAKTGLDGVASMVADADGTVSQPGLKASVKLDGVTYKGQAAGNAVADVHSEGKNLYYTINSTLLGAKIDANGQVQMAGDFPAQGKVTVTGLDVGKPLAMFGASGIKAQSMINGSVTVSGPLKTPKLLSGEGVFNQVDVKLQGVELKAAEPLRIGLQNGVATLEQVHITGQDTDMRASGTAQLFGSTDPKGGKLDVKATGSVSVALLHTFDPDLNSSGKMEFTIAAGGRVMKPALTGRVQFDNVNIAMDGVPNGLSNMNGTLVFNQDRLQVEKLTATTGGGQLNIGGSIRYQNGVYADLTATGDTVRVRLYGLSATANAKLRLQGGPDSSLLSGNILLTRFGVGADVDFAAFSSVGGVSAPPDPNAPANKIRLDVHITSAPQLDFQNSYAKLAGSVDLTIRGTVAVPSVLGRIEINDGSATFAGTKYQLQRGEIYFTNPVRIDPTIDLDATARVETYDITVGLHGTATNLKPTYRSEPPLSESDIFALLALGRTQEEAQLYQEKQMQAGTDPTTSALLGGALNATVSNRVEKLFGVGSVKIDPAFVGTLGNSSARITVQQQLSRQITATFATNVNSSAQQLIQVEYDLNPTSSIVVTRDESGVFSIVYKLRRRYR